MDQDEFLPAGLGLLLVGLDETVYTTMERIDLGRVDVGATDPMNAIVAKLDVILANLGLVGTLSHPFVTIDLVVSHGHSIVEQNGPRGRRRSGRILLRQEDGLCCAPEQALMGIGEDAHYLVDVEPPRMGGLDDGLAVNGGAHFEFLFVCGYFHFLVEISCRTCGRRGEKCELLIN